VVAVAWGVGPPGLLGVTLGGGATKSLGAVTHLFTNEFFSELSLPPSRHQSRLKGVNSGRWPLAFSLVFCGSLVNSDLVFTRACVPALLPTARFP